MGVSNLWKFLEGQNLVHHLQGSVAGQHAEIVSKVDGKVIAVDLAQWIFHATMQPDLTQAVESEAARCQKIAFERVLNMLRYGCVPVGVMDGQMPPEKLQRLRQRYLGRTGFAGGGGGSTLFERNNWAMRDIFKAMGLPVVDAPGEAEALCAALNKRGLVDACATSDGDVLLFGAECVFHTMKLQAQTVTKSELKVCQAADIRRSLGLISGGHRALQVMACLSGGDYDVDGLAKVGGVGAIRVVAHLLQGKQDDSQVLQAFAKLLERDPNEHLASLKHCTGCKQCGHEGHRASRVKCHNSRNACAECPGTAGGTCAPRAFAPDECTCEFHRRAVDRMMDKVVRKAKDAPEFARTAARAQRAYQTQMQEALAAVDRYMQRNSLAPGQKLKWLRRPSPAAVAAAVDGPDGLQWAEDKARRKMLPLLMEWDLRRAAAEGPTASGLEFRIVELQKAHQQHAETEADVWRYIAKWERLPAGTPEAQQQDADDLTSKGLLAEVRAVRISLLQELAPHLITEFKQRAAQKADKAAQAEERRAKKARDAEAKRQHELKGVRDLRTMLLQPRKAAAAAAAAAGGAASAAAGKLRREDAAAPPRRGLLDPEVVMADTLRDLDDGAGPASSEERSKRGGQSTPRKAPDSVDESEVLASPSKKRSSPQAVLLTSQLPSDSAPPAREAASTVRRALDATQNRQGGAQATLQAATQPASPVPARAPGKGRRARAAAAGTASLLAPRFGFTARPRERPVLARLYESSDAESDQAGATQASLSAQSGLRGAASGEANADEMHGAATAGPSTPGKRLRSDVRSDGGKDGADCAGQPECADVGGFTSSAAVPQLLEDGEPAGLKNSPQSPVLCTPAQAEGVENGVSKERAGACFNAVPRAGLLLAPCSEDDVIDLITPSNASEAGSRRFDDAHSDCIIDLTQD